MKLYPLFLLVIGFIVACTQFAEQEEISKNQLSTEDGCVYCHTNKDRLEALAVEEEGGEAGGG